jgi:hypothetical protein
MLLHCVVTPFVLYLVFALALSENYKACIVSLYQAKGSHRLSH